MSDTPVKVLNKPKYKTYPAHGSGWMTYYDVPEMDAFIAQLQAENIELQKLLTENARRIHDAKR